MFQGRRISLGAGSERILRLQRQIVPAEVLTVEAQAAVQAQVPMTMLPRTLVDSEEV